MEEDPSSDSDCDITEEIDEEVIPCTLTHEQMTLQALQMLNLISSMGPVLCCCTCNNQLIYQDILGVCKDTQKHNIRCSKCAKLRKTQ